MKRKLTAIITVFILTLSLTSAALPFDTLATSENGTVYYIDASEGN